MRLILRLRYAALMRRCHHEVARSYACERWSREALDRAQARFGEAAILAARLGLLRTAD